MNGTAGNTLRSFGSRSIRGGLTLLELVVVLVILAALAALVVPRLSGISSQANSATNTAIVDDVNRAMNLYEARYGTDNSKKLNGWDSLLQEGGAFFGKLHPNLQAGGGMTADVTKPALKILTLTDIQTQSLIDAKVTGLHDAVSTRVCQPSDNSSAYRTFVNFSSGAMVSGEKVVALEKPSITAGHGSTFIDLAFNVNQYKSNWNNEFVVVGLGGPSPIKGATIQELPLVQSANPTQYYARPLLVFMIPSSTATTGFPAQYVGCFLPDGTSQRSNAANFNSGQVTAN